MALLRCDFFSDVLGISTSMTVVLPQATTAQIGMTGAATSGPPPVLYLLHGLSDDATVWTRRTSIERYVADRGLAVVMPQVDRSFYVDERHGNRYGTFLTDELPAVVGQFFNVSGRREDTFVAGLSMGGYGAMRWALSRPESFGAAASLSGVLDVASVQEGGGRRELFERVFGTGHLRGSEHDLLALLGRADASALPRLYTTCGTDDPLLTHQERFTAAAVRAGADVTSVPLPGAHDWSFWDATVQHVLDWLPLGDRAAAPPPHP